MIRRFLSGRDRTRPISELAGELLEQCGDRNYLLKFYSRDRLFGAEARSRWVPPDLAELSRSDGHDERTVAKSEAALGELDRGDEHGPRRRHGI